MAGGGYWYYTSSQETIQELRDNNAQLVSSVQKAEEALEVMQENFTNEEKQNKALMISLNRATDYNEELLSKLQRHDLTKLSAAKPGLIERRINDATKEIFDDLESTTSE